MEKQDSKYKTKNIILGILLVFNLVAISLFLYFLSPVSKTSEEQSFVVTKGMSLKEIGEKLETEGFIKNDKVFLGYLMLKDTKKIYAAKYTLNKNMSLNEIVTELKKGGKSEVVLTIKEGYNMRQIAKLISKQTNNSYASVLEFSNNEEYINQLMSKYWFITKDIKNNKIYYKLEGYLYPDSYNFASKNVELKEIFDKILENTNEKLSKYKQDMTKNSYSVHQILTLASVIELEGLDKKSRKDISGVFYNRLKAKMILGSDVTTYYGVGKDMTSDLTNSQLNDPNPYNTRALDMTGKLPVGPIDNPSISSIVAALKPNKHNYYYFVADKNGKVYLTKDYETHNKLIVDLKDKGLWYEW